MECDEFRPAIEGEILVSSGAAFFFVAAAWISKYI